MKDRQETRHSISPLVQFSSGVATQQAAEIKIYTGNETR